MSNNLVDLFKNSIHTNNIPCAKENKIFLDKKYKYIFPYKHDYICFTLDDNNNKTKNNFPFFADDNHRLKGIKKMCDEIVIIFKKNKNYIFCIERKSGDNIDKKVYKKQIINGKYFCNWLINLLKEHGHFTGNDKEIEFEFVLLRYKKATLKKSNQFNKKHVKKNGLYEMINQIIFSQLL